MANPDSHSNADTPDRVIRVGNKTYHLVRRRDGAGMELVRAYPDDGLSTEEEAERRRTGAVDAYGNYRSAPRNEAPANIDKPVAKRTQTILSHEVDADTRAALNGQPAPPANRGRR